MTGTLIDSLAEIEAIYEVSSHDDYHLQMHLVDADGEPPRGYERVMNDVTVPGRYVLIRVGGD